MENSEVVKELAIASVANKTIINETGASESVIVLPSGCSLADLDKFREKPRRIEIAENVQSVESFTAYIDKFKLDETVVFGMQGDKTPFSAVMDYHQRGLAGWCRHIVKLGVTHTDEWNTWTKHEKARFSQRDFLHFIEDNVLVIAKPETAKLVESIKNVKISGSNNVNSKIDHSAETTDASATTTIDSGVPENLQLALMPWNHSSPYKVEARIFIHVDSGKVSFSYHLINANRVLDHLFKDYREQIEKKTSLAVFV